MSFTSRIIGACWLVVLGGCSSSTTPNDGGLPAVDAAGRDGGRADGGRADAGSPFDAGADAGTPTDAGTTVDAGAPADAGTAADAGTPPIDAGGRVPMYHRPDDSQCSAPAPAGNCSFGGGGSGMCSSDSDCTGGVDGRCNMNLGGAVFCRCTYDTCVHDTDCPTGQTCACHGAAFHTDGNTCIAGNCRVDSDCGAGGYCSPTTGGCGGLAGYYCHTASDDCIDDSDCGSTATHVCQYSTTDGRWECMMRLLCP